MEQPELQQREVGQSEAPQLETELLAIEQHEIQKLKIGQPEIQKSEIQQPEAPQPEIQQPEIQQPEIQQPEIQQPEIQQPEIQQPEIQQPEIQQPEIQQPEIQQPEIQQPEVPRLKTAQPEVGQPEAPHLEITQPEIEEPEPEQSGIQKLKIEQPEVGRPEIQEGEIEEPEIQQPEIRCPYSVGNKITLQLKAASDKTISVDAKILRLFEPFTLSCVMVVRINCPDLALDGNEEMVLKVFDRRFATGARDGEKMQPWSLKLEKDYNQFIHDEVGSQFVTALPDETEDPPREQATELWNSSHEEAYLHYILDVFYQSELRVYNILPDFQGKGIPRLIADVLVPVEGSAMPQPQIPGFPGLLLQFIPGFPLTDLGIQAPRELWQSICDTAVRFINIMGDRGILNEDVQTRSFIVDLAIEEATGFKLTMIDFGLCSFRDEYEDEQEWTESKGVEEEEEAIGRVMQSKLDGGFVYNQSFRYRKPSSYYEGGEGFE